MSDYLPTLSEEAVFQRIDQEMFPREPHDLPYPISILALITVNLTVPARGFRV